MNKAEKEQFFIQHILVCESALKGLICQKMSKYSEQVTEEILQNTMFKAWQFADQVTGPQKAKSWLYQIARNEIKLFYRKQDKAIARTPVSFDAFDSEDVKLEEKTAIKEHALDFMIRDFEIQIALKALRELDEESRKLIIMRYVKEVPALEMAETLNLKPGTSTSKVARALKKYRHLYAKGIEGTLGEEVSETINEDHSM